MISTFYDSFTGLKMQRVGQRSGENVEIITIHERQYVIRILNTLVGSAVALLFSDLIRSDGVGTHLVENSIGIARQSSNDPRSDRIISSYAHAEIRKKESSHHCLRLNVQGRINDGGCKINEITDVDNDDLISKTDSWSVSNIIQLFRGLYNPEITETMIGNLMIFASELESLLPLVDQHFYDINQAANNGILARLISFKSITQPEIPDE